MTTFQRRLRKLVYYLTRIFGSLLPEALFPVLRKSHINYLPASDRRVDERVHYYNKLDGLQILPPELSGHLSSLYSWTPSVYHYDLYEYMRYFPKGPRFSFVFGDVTEVFAHPVFVKSRPLAGDNSNSVLMKLNKLRHFLFVQDTLRFEDKTDTLVWRGEVYLPHRQEFMRKFFGRKGFDIGQVNSRRAENPAFVKPWMSIQEQLRHKFVFSIEGNDVASNLKWIMSSNSLCLMPAPKFETWFMEGTLKAGEHYGLVRDDFSDLEEKMEYYASHPAEAKAIIANANRYTEQFQDERLERQIALMVIQKYFEHTR
jgi:hypothetical protein